MRKWLLLGTALLPVAAFAGGETFDTPAAQNGAISAGAPFVNIGPLGLGSSASNPLYVTGGSGSSGAAAAGPSATQGSSSSTAVPVQDAKSGAPLGLDSSLQSIINVLNGNLRATAPGGGALALDSTVAGVTTALGKTLSVNVGNFPATQPVSSSTLAQDATLTGGNLVAKVSSLPALPAGSNAIGSVSVSNLPATQAVSAASLPLPAGAAQDSTLTGGSAKTQVTSLPALPAGTNTIGAVNLGTGGLGSSSSNPLYVSGTAGGAAGGGGSTPSASQGAASTTAVPVQDAASGKALALDSSAQAINTTLGGTLTAKLAAGTAAIGSVTAGGTFPVSAASLPLPTGAAQDGTLTGGSAKTQVTSLPSIPTGSNTIGAVTAGGTFPVSSSSLAQDSSVQSVVNNTTGLATASAQSTGNTSLASIATNTGAGATAANQTNGSQVTKLAAGTAAIGTVGVSSLPSLPAGTANIGRVASPTGAGTAPANRATSATANTSNTLFTAGAIVNGAFVQVPHAGTQVVVVDWGGGTPASPVAPQEVAPGETITSAFVPTNAVTMWSVAGTSVAVNAGSF